MKIPVITIFAPTATGKTALALNLFAKGSRSFFKEKAELVSADSMQVYRKLNIGTAKPTLEEQKILPHHLIDILDYDEQFSVSDFVEKADEACDEIWKRKKIPLVIGGTGFYIRNFIFGLPKTPVSDEDLRNELKKRIKIEGKEALHEELKKADPVSASKINVNDEYRIIRALEVYKLTGKPRSSFFVNESLRNKYDFLTIVLDKNRKLLYEKINLRVDKMFEMGLKEEVFSLMKEGATKEMPGMKGIGYREWFLYDWKTCEGIEKIKAEIKHSSRKYAKKQYTFMNDIPFSKKINADNEKLMIEEVSELVKDFFSKYNFALDLNI